MFMINVMFVCHGNICRSPMAEYLFTDLVKKKGKEKYFNIKSSATSYEEIGNPVHYGTERILSSLNIDCSVKRAQKLTNEDGEKYDYFIGMDEENLYFMRKILGEKYYDKIFLLLEFVGESDNVADPWFTGDFNRTYTDIKRGLTGFYNYLINTARELS